MSSELPRRARLNVPSPNPERTSYARFIPREELHDFASWTPGSLGQAAAVATPAARAGSAFMSTEEGYAAFPPGT